MAWGADTHQLEADLSLATYQGDKDKAASLRWAIRDRQGICQHRPSPEPGRTHCWKCGLDLAKPGLVKTQAPESSQARKHG